MSNYHVEQLSERRFAVIKTDSRWSEGDAFYSPPETIDACRTEKDAKALASEKTLSDMSLSVEETVEIIRTTPELYKRLRHAKRYDKAFLHMEIDSADFSGCNLYDMNFSGMKFSGCNFNGANMSRVCFDGTLIEECTFHDAIVNSANFSRAVIYDCSFVGATIFWSKFPVADIQRTSFTGAKMWHCDFSRVDNLSDVSFAGSDLYGAHFAQRRLDSCEFSGADTREVDFFGTIWDTTNGYIPRDDDEENTYWQDYDSGIMGV